MTGCAESAGDTRRISVAGKRLRSQLGDCGERRHQVLLVLGRDGASGPGEGNRKRSKGHKLGCECLG